MKNKQTLNKSQTNNQKGFTLLEIIIVLVIIALIGIGIIGYQITANNSRQATTETQNITSLATIIKQTFSGVNIYSGLSNERMTRSGSFPTNMRVEGQDSLIRSSWQIDGVDLEPYTYNYQDDGFAIIYKNVPETACFDLVNNLWTYFDVNTGAGIIESDSDINNSCTSEDANEITISGQ